MALDLISAEHQRKIDGTQAVFSLNENIHNTLMSLAVPKNQFPVLHKLDDYYSDATLVYGELKSLKDELSKILKKTGKIQEIEEFISFVETSIAEENNIYATAD